MRSSFPVVVALVMVACSRPVTLASFEGKITMRNTTPQSAEPHDLVVTAKGDKLRFDAQGQPTMQNHAVYDPAINKVLMFFDGTKQYMELDFAAPGGPAPNTDPNSASIVSHGTTKLVAGYKCDEWTAKDGAGHRAEVCLAEGVAFLDLNRLRSGGPESPLAKQFREHKSFPLESVEFDANGKEISRMHVTTIERTKVPDDAFTIPSGYAKVDPPQRKPPVERPPMK